MNAQSTLSEKIDFHDLEAVRLALVDGSSAIVSRFGAQVLSWQPVGAGERLYLSAKADFGGGSSPSGPIRGGIPVIFPQFAERGLLPRHGFARTAIWTLDSIEDLPDTGYDGTARATFSLRADDHTRAIWPHDFTARLVVTLSKGRLNTALEIHNTGADSLRFTGALHTYLSIEDARQVSLTGLQGCQRLQPGQSQPDTEPRAELTLEDAIDNIYLNVGRPQFLTHGHHALAISASGFPDVVVWNPWREHCAALPDMEDDDYRYMLCVEAAAIGQPIELAPGQRWRGSQELSTLDTE